MRLGILFHFTTPMLAVIMLIACHSIASKPSVEQPFSQQVKAMSNNSFSLDMWISLRNLSMQEIQNRFSISEQNIDQDAKYIKLSHVNELHNSETHPGYFYFRDGKFVLLYVGKCQELQQLNPAVLQENLGGAGIRLRSRSGKKFNHYVYPEKGVAFSADSNNVRFVEIFPPTSLEAYKSEFYEEPPAFIK